MQQIYVVVSQENSLTGNDQVPVAAYTDYPSALAYAQSIFKTTFDPTITARDLVFLVSLNQAVAAK